MLQYGASYNHNINNLPPNLKILKIGRDINKIGKISQSLKVFKFGGHSNLNIDIGTLPGSLRVLKLNRKFNSEINNLPKSLKVLELGYNFNQKQ